MRQMRRSLLMMLWSFLPLVSAVSQTILTNFPLTYPNAIASNPVTNRIYVASGNNSTVTVINGVDDSLVTVPAGFNPTAVAVNTVTNKIYVTDYSDYVITIIDGATNLTSTVPVSGHPQAVAVNSVTNQIYVLASGQNDSGILNVIDGTTLATTTVATGNSPVGVVVDPVTNFIYVLNANLGPGSVSCIDGRTLSVRTVQVSTQPSDIAVNVKTNKIYVASSTDNDVIVIDGATLTTTVVPADNYPARIALNPATNKIYLANSGGQSVTVLDGLTLSMTDVPIGGNAQYIALDPVTNKIYVTVWNFSTGDLLVMVDGLTNATSSASLYRPTVLGTNPATNRVYVSASVVTNGPVDMVVAAAPDPVGMQFVPVAPCRVVDTRNPNGPFGGPAISGGASRSFALPSGPCSSIPSTAVAYSLNVTAIPVHTLSYLTIWPTGGSRPVVSTLNSFDGRTKANAAIVPAGTGKAVSVYVSDTSNVVLDIDGYFVPAPNNTALEFYKLTPCRVADTRNPDGPLGGPYLQAEQAREFPVLEAQACGIPGTAQAYSMNFTVIPKNSQPLSYLTIWPSGLSRPVVSTLNDPTGTIVANAGIVPAGTGGDISAYATADTDLVIDINGYFAPAATNGLSLFSMWPCRSLDTRGGSGVFSGTLPVDIVDSLCGVGYGSLAYVFNATVLPSGPLGYLTLWPNGAQQPLVSTLNAPDGATTSNMAVVPTNNGVINAFATSPTQLLLDVSGYFSVLPQLRVLTPSLPVATTGTPYGAMFNAAGGAPPYSWSIGSGLLPDGLSLNANTGAITGTPTGSGVSEFTAKVTDSNSLVATANLSIGVQSSALTITTAFLPPATVGVPYSAQLQATGGIPPYNWQLSWGRLPSGLSLDANTGIISGTPTVYDSESFDVLVGDSNPTQNTDFVTLGIGANPATLDRALWGQFAFSLNGYQNSQPFYAAGTFYADGNGNLSRGVIDWNGSGGPTNNTFTGTYAIQGNGLGALTFNTSHGTLNFFVSIGDSTDGTGTIILDNADPQPRGSGTIKEQSSLYFSLQAIAGSFAFGSTGADSGTARLAAVGAFQLDGSGNLTNGERDSNDNGTVSNQSFTATLSAPDSLTGRGTATFTINSGTSHFAYYIINNEQLNFISTDPVSNSTPLVLTSAFNQPAGWNFTDASLSGNDVLELTGSRQSHSDLITGIANADGQGNINLSFDENFNGTVTQGTAQGTYNVSSNGRVTTAGLGRESMILYLTGGTIYPGLPAAFLLGTDSSVKSGVAETQFGGPFSNSTLVREYLGGTVTKAIPVTADAVDWLFADGNGNMNLLEDYSAGSGIGSSGFNGVYQIQSNGRGVVSDNGSQQAIVYVVNPNRCFVLPLTADSALKVLSSRQGY